jgi:hypothetical protein
MNPSFSTGPVVALALGLTCVPAYGQAPPAQPVRRDVGKSVIELPTKNIVAGFTAPAAQPDNPAVPPGQVQWHPTFEAACAAAQKSGKPVLLFQMLGRLDQQFC